MKAEAFKKEIRRIHQVEVVITTYQIGMRYFCQIANKDPGAQLSRAEGTSYQDAFDKAFRVAEAKLQPQ